MPLLKPQQNVDAKKRFKYRKLKLVNLGDGGELLGKSVLVGGKEAAGEKRKHPDKSTDVEEDPMFEGQTHEPSVDQKWTWTNAGNHQFDFKAMVHAHQKQGSFPEVEFANTMVSETRWKCSVNTTATTNAQNSAYSNVSEEDAMAKAAQMNLYVHDAFPVPAAGEHEVWAGIRFSNTQMPPQYTFKRWLVAHLLDEAVDMETFQFPVYTKTMQRIADTVTNHPTGVAWSTAVNVNGTEHSSGGKERPFEAGKLSENCAALQALIVLGVAKQQEFEYGRLVIREGNKLRDVLPSDKAIVQAAKKIVKNENGEEVLSREAYLEKLRNDLKKYCEKSKWPGPQMLTAHNPDGSITATATVYMRTYTGYHRQMPWKAMTQAAEMALFSLKQLKKEDSRYLKELDKMSVENQPQVAFLCPTCGQEGHRPQECPTRIHSPMMQGPPRPMMGRPPRPGMGPGGPLPRPGMVRGGPPRPGMVRGGPPRPGMMRGGPPRPRGAPRGGMVRGGPPPHPDHTMMEVSPRPMFMGGPRPRASLPGHRGRGMPPAGAGAMHARGAVARGMPGQRARGMPVRGARGGMNGVRPPRTKDPSTVTWSTVKQHLKEYLEHLGESIPTYSVGESDLGLFMAVITFHCGQPRSYTGRQQRTKKAAEQDAAELALVSIGYLPRRILTGQPDAGAPPAHTAAAYTVSYHEDAVGTSAYHTDQAYQSPYHVDAYHAGAEEFYAPGLDMNPAYAPTYGPADQGWGSYGSAGQQW